MLYTKISKLGLGIIRYISELLLYIEDTILINKMLLVIIYRIIHSIYINIYYIDNDSKEYIYKVKHK